MTDPTEPSGAPGAPPPGVPLPRRRSAAEIAAAVLASPADRPTIGSPADQIAAAGTPPPAVPPDVPAGWSDRWRDNVTLLPDWITEEIGQLPTELDREEACRYASLGFLAGVTHVARLHTEQSAARERRR